jgi:hypothetical protein
MCGTRDPYVVHPINFLKIYFPLPCIVLLRFQHFNKLLFFTVFHDIFFDKKLLNDNVANMIDKCIELVVGRFGR